MALIAAATYAHASNKYYSGPYGHKEASAANNYPSNTYAPGRNSPYGPYHSYAVRPALYGGHGLYNYKGYTRYHPAPPYTGAPSYKSGAYGPGHGLGHNGGSLYGMRPVKALLLVPEHSYKALAHGHGASAKYPAHYGSGGAHAKSYRKNRNYLAAGAGHGNSLAGASSYRYGPHSGSLYVRHPSSYRNKHHTYGASHLYNYAPAHYNGAANNYAAAPASHNIRYGRY